MRLPFAILVLVGAAVGPAPAADSPGEDIEAYKQKMSQCVSQMASDHPEMSAHQQRKACKQQLGPAPKGVVPAKAPAPVL